MHNESDIQTDYCGVTDYSACYQPTGNHLCKGQAQKQMQGQRNCISITMPDFTYYVSKTQKYSTNAPRFRNIHVFILLPLMMVLIQTVILLGQGLKFTAVFKTMLDQYNLKHWTFSVHFHVNHKSTPPFLGTDLHRILHLVKTSHCHGSHLCIRSGTSRAG